MHVKIGRRARGRPWGKKDEREEKEEESREEEVRGAVTQPAGLIGCAEDKEKRELVERGRKTGLVVSTRQTLTSH